jgi:hypothetical protein
MLPFARRPGFPCSGTPASRHGPNRRTCLTAKRAPGRRVLLPGPHAMISIHNFVILNEVNRCSPQTQRPLADFAERTRRRSQVNSAYRCLTALRLSLSSLLGRVRKRPLRSLRSSIRFARHVIAAGAEPMRAPLPSKEESSADKHRFRQSRESSLCGPETPPAEASKRAPQAQVRKSLRTLPWNTTGSAREQLLHPAFGRVQSAGYDPRIVALLLAGQKLQNPPCNYGRGPCEHRPDASRGVR